MQSNADQANLPSGSNRILHRVANASCKLLMFCELRVTSCTYCASYELRVALIMRVASCELRVERKVRVGNSKVRVETKSASCLFSFVERPFLQIKRYSKVAFQFATFLRVFFYEKHF